MKEETVIFSSYKSNGERVETTRKGKIIYDSYGNPAFFINSTEGLKIAGSDKLWDPLTPNGVHGWLKENNKKLVYESSTQSWKIEESSESL